ncbi:hypothetical protein PPL_02117 [Heterostelium album PN500]|uniref:Uncharacterized protein n=1 Tax=Heterostelium pallidum (strain ATCC 26659 / Pp 5 / PN500) TaxID=670386 RepID=D3B1E6_HETP5|nr:hypothetical protein PPL_02117 [Heterostelium album PN500]EFA85120.1 hypothetical protein PPL_02117 [Heterostelium album PN500]|eukprot:XP_020437229.1 hypothetical protein PPL_02117 [Heterostelium album PN500]
MHENQTKTRNFKIFQQRLHSIVGYCTSLVKEEIGRGHEFESRWSLYKSKNYACGKDKKFKNSLTLTSQ